MKYDDDQCERCGGVRVAKSTLCADCLVKERDFLEKEILIKGVAIEMLRKKLEIQTGRLQDALSYGFKKNRENNVLIQHGMTFIKEIEEALRDEENRIQENKT